MGKDNDRSRKDSSPSKKSKLQAQLEDSDVQNVHSTASPTRSTSTILPRANSPSAVPAQRSISPSNDERTSLDGVLEATRDRIQGSGQTTPSWPTSSRLKSPPPTSLRSMLPRRTEGESTQPNTSIKRLTPSSLLEVASQEHVPQGNGKEQQVSAPIRVASRVTGPGLETVNEGSSPNTPPTALIRAPIDEDAANRQPPTDASEPSSRAIVKKDDVPAPMEHVVSKLNISKSDFSSTSSAVPRTTSNVRPDSNLARRSFTSLTNSKIKSSAEPVRTMTVETETVSAALQPIGDRGRDLGGSIRARPSNETIRPKKEKKKPVRKAPSLQAGTGTSKADIFEAKVASAVDEADSSDSDETFVYESNPPEPRQGRHHSRTPSATSLASQADFYGGRNKQTSRSGSTAIPGKRSMKFSSSHYGAQIDADGSAGDAGRGSTRTHSSTLRPHHIGRHGRNGHLSIMDTNSPFNQTNRISSPRTPTGFNSRHSRPTSPRVSNGRAGATSRRNTAGGYDIYDDGADDERAPLVGSVRVNRPKYGRKSLNQGRSMDFEGVEPRCWSRFGGCMLLGFLVLLVCFGITTFVMALNRPLLDVEVAQIQNVLASEQELILDLHVTAINPNLFPITVNDLDVDMFAESPYAGTNAEWSHHTLTTRSSWMNRRRVPSSPNNARSFWFPPFRPNDGVDEGTDPIEEEPGTQKLLLGRVFSFESPLTFDASPVHHNPSSSVGEIRLVKPGNKTEIGGSARWEKVIQHSFNLIVRGVIKYQLPLGSQTRSAKINGRIKVLPDNNEGDHSPEEQEQISV